jgi:hypothetical protein
LAEGFKFLEGPRWRDGRLWMSDSFGGQVFTLGPEGDVETVIEVPGKPSGLGFLPDGTPLVVSMEDRRLLRLEDGALVGHAEIGGLVSGVANDMVVDAQGRAYVGAFGFDLFGGEDFRPTNLVMVSPEGEAQVVAEKVEFPNGSVILPGGEVMVVAETFGHCLTACQCLQPRHLPAGSRRWRDHPAHRSRRPPRGRLPARRQRWTHAVLPYLQGHLGGGLRQKHAGPRRGRHRRRSRRRVTLVARARVPDASARSTPAGVHGLAWPFSQPTKVLTGGRSTPGRVWM